MMATETCYPIGEKTRKTAHSFTGIMPVYRPEENEILQQDSFEKVTRRKISDIAGLMAKPKQCLRKLSLMSIKRDIPKRKRGLNDFKLYRSNSLPDTKTLNTMDADFLKKLNSKKCDLTKTRSVTFHLETVCLNAAADNDLVELRKIMNECDIDLNYQNSCGQNMAHCAASAGSYETLEYLIEEGIGVNVYDQRSCTPLDLAIKGGFFDCALLLIKAGARVENIVNGVTQ